MPFFWNVKIKKGKEEEKKEEKIKRKREIKKWKEGK